MVMNANELADKLDWHWDNDCRSPAISKSADMLRQQQAEIRDLQQQVAFLEDYRAVWAPVIRQHQGLDK
jgi:hypothetical protein